jgi:hypothetical protein
MSAGAKRAIKSTIGRPRVLTDAQVAAVFAWHDAVRMLKAQRAAIKTLRQLANSLGVTHGAITSVIRRGQLKQLSPELRGDEAS